MKTKILTIVILTTISFSGMSQGSERRTVVRKNTNGIVRSVSYSSADRSVRIPESSDVFFREVLKTQEADRFEKRPHRSTMKEFVHELFQQYYNGVKVEGGGYNFHYRNGVMNFAHGNYVRIDNVDTTPSFFLNLVV